MTGWVERVGCYDEGTSRGVLSGCVLRVCQQGMSKVSLILPATHRVDIDRVGAASVATARALFVQLLGQATEGGGGTVRHI